MKIPNLTIMITIYIFKKTIRFDVMRNRQGGLNMSSKDLIKEFRNKYNLYYNFTTTLHELISTILKNESVRIHSVNARTKSIESLTDKVKKPNKKYNKLY